MSKTNCSASTTILLDAELGLASDAATAALQVHLENCPGCSARAARERRLSAALATLRVELPFPIDVTETVARRILQVLGFAFPII